jgi:hypothetical protein
MGRETRKMRAERKTPIAVPAPNRSRVFHGGGKHISPRERPLHVSFLVRHAFPTIDPADKLTSDNRRDLADAVAVALRFQNYKREVVTDPIALARTASAMAISGLPSALRCQLRLDARDGRGSPSGRAGRRWQAFGGQLRRKRSERQSRLGRAA